MLLTGLLLAVAAVVWLEPTTVRESDAAAAAIIFLHVLAHAVPNRLKALSGSVESINYDDMLFPSALLILTPTEWSITVLFASVAGSLILRRAPEKAVFNAGQYLVASIVGYVLYRLLAGTSANTLDLRSIFAAGLGGIVVSAVSRVAVMSMIAYVTRQRWSALVKLPRSLVAAWFSGAIVGTNGAALALTFSWGILPVILLVGVVQRAINAQWHEETARTQAERLQQHTSVLRATSRQSDVEHSLVTSAADLLGARGASILRPGNPVPENALSAPMPGGQLLVVHGRIGPGSWSQQEREILTTLAGVGDDTLRSVDLISRLRSITDAQTEGVISLDVDGVVTFANPAAVRMLRASSASDVVGHELSDLARLRRGPQRIDVAEMTRLGEQVHDGDAALYLMRGKAAQSGRLEVAYSFNPLTDASEGTEPTGSVLVLRDVSERRAFQEAMTYRAMHDELTGLPNRRLLVERLDATVSSSSTDGLRHVVIFVDLDRFKLVNDSYGHLVGDQLLIQLSDRLQEQLGVSDSAARLSGDEFVMLLQDCPDDAEVTRIVENLAVSLRKPYLIDGHAIYITVSLGVTITYPGQTREEIMVAADAAAYAAKSAGRNCIRYSSPELVAAAGLRLEMESQLRTAIEANGLRLHYQPIIDTKTQTMVGAEALVRWNRDGVPQSPAEFISLAEDSGLIIYLGRWVMEEACRTTHRWNTRYPEREPVMVSVNLSALQLTQPNLADEIEAVLNRTGLPAWQLTLEITETAVLFDIEANLPTLRELREIGVRVSVDDFGTGYSSLAYLRRLPVDTVKLDAAFIAGLGRDPVDTQIVAAVLRLCKALGRTVVAEGVETEVQRQFLAWMGCPLMQGFLLARPMDAQRFEDYWDRMYDERPPLVSLPESRATAAPRRVRHPSTS
ncbi:MAG: EAL domain-containing protein [Actinomycetota bacterium]|nr:EAL domain-containing protein [Actinomycetota bacterium]